MHSNDPTQWNDTDGDGYGDNFANNSWLNIRPMEWPGELVTGATNVDVFPLDRTQWADSDGDWVGDEQASSRPDGCPNAWGDSQFDRLGCPDSDGDGWSDPTLVAYSQPLVMTEQTHSLMTQHSGAMMTEMVLEAINPEIMLTIVLVIQEHQLKID